MSNQIIFFSVSLLSVLQLCMYVYRGMHVREGTSNTLGKMKVKDKTYSSAPNF